MELEIEKDADESAWNRVRAGVNDEYRSCRNKCMFCFIDQMPEGMRVLFILKTMIQDCLFYREIM